MISRFEIESNMSQIGLNFIDLAGPMDSQSEKRYFVQFSCLLMLILLKLIPCLSNKGVPYQHDKTHDTWPSQICRGSEEARSSERLW